MTHFSASWIVPEREMEAYVTWREDLSPCCRHQSLRGLPVLPSRDPSPHPWSGKLIYLVKMLEVARSELARSPHALRPWRVLPLVVFLGYFPQEAAH